MLDIMLDEWAGLLLESSSSNDDPNRLPSPGELRKRILVKVKAAAQGKVLTGDNPTSSLPAIEQIRSSSSSSLDETIKQAPQMAKKSKILEALSRLGIYTKSYHFSSLRQPGKVHQTQSHVEIGSLILRRGVITYARVLLVREGLDGFA